MVFKGLQAEALTIEDRDDLFHQHRSNRSAAGNIPQLIRAPSLTARIGHFHAISSLHQWCMLHQVDLTVSMVKSLTWLTSTCLRTLNWWMLTFQWGACSDRLCPAERVLRGSPDFGDQSPDRTVTPETATSSRTARRRMIGHSQTMALTCSI
jgi:hypothetical protein